jgi:hypothetical protein
MRILPAIPIKLPVAINIQTALAVYHLQRRHRISAVHIMAADWQENPEHGEEDWFVELTSDELEAEDFLEDFAEARFELWSQSDELMVLFLELEP